MAKQIGLTPHHRISSAPVYPISHLYLPLHVFLQHAICWTCSQKLKYAITEEQKLYAHLAPSFFLGFFLTRSSSVRTRSLDRSPITFTFDSNSEDYIS